MKTVIDLNRWQEYLHIYIAGETRRKPQMNDRLPREFTYDHTRDTIVNLLWNELHRGSKYEWDKWDVDITVEKWFEDYYPYENIYSRGRRQVDETDKESETIYDCLERLRRKISNFVIDNDLMSPWKLYELYSHGRESFVLEVWGDHRIKEWSEAKGIEYDQYTP